MSSAVAVKPDQRQRPRVESKPGWVSSQADDAAFFAAAYGLAPDPWQRHVLDGWLGETASGRWAVGRAGLAVPRQNGKNAVLEIRELYGMVALGEKFLHTAHEVKTARKAFLRLAGFFDNKREWPELYELVDRTAGGIRRTNGQEAITLTNGGSVEFVARSRGSGRGYTVDVLVCDEAQELTDEQLEALLPTISSAPTGNPQILLTGTPPPPGAAAEVFERTRGQALAGGSARLGWDEWSMDDDDDVDDRDVWYATNPALGIRLGLEAVETERETFSEDGFARERLGSWTRQASLSPIDPDVWHESQDRKSRRAGKVAFAVDMPPEGNSATIAVAGRRQDGRWHVEVVEQAPGTAWVPERLADLHRNHKAPVMLDPGSPAGSLLPSLADADVPVETVTGREMAAACVAFLDDVNEDRVRHIGQPVLSTAAAAARRRNVGESWAWHRRNVDSDISPLVAVTLARWCASKNIVQKKRSGRVI